MSVLASMKARLRQFKPAWAAYNMLHYRKLSRNADLYRRFGIRRSVVAPIAHRDITRPSDEIPWLDRPNAGAALAAHEELDSFPPAIRESLKGWVENGYVILERYLSEERVDSINSEVESLFEQGEIAFHFRDNRIMNSFRKSAKVAEAAKDPELMRLLSFLLGREVVLFQTINFFEGSQQPPHSDSFHMTTEPMGYLIAIWVALEDVSPDSGPVFYYPGTHTLDYVMKEHLEQEDGSLEAAGKSDREYEDKIAEVVAATGIQPVDFLAKKGDVLIWHANLIHGGKPIAREGLTRKSLVAHYFGKGVLCYHEVTERPALVES